MKPRPLFKSAKLLFVASLFAAAGCNVIPPVQPDTTRYYLLSDPKVSEAAVEVPAGTLHLGVRPVEVVPYLRRGSMVVRTGANEISFVDSARWAEPVDKEIAAALRRKLSLAPAVARVFVAPFPVEPTRDYDVSVHVLHCEGVREAGGGNVARFAATIEISTVGNGARLIARKTFIAPDAAWDGKDFSQLAALLSDAVAALGQEVVAALPAK